MNLVGSNCGLNQGIVPETEELICEVTERGYEKTSQRSYRAVISSDYLYSVELYNDE
jgi:hypothetical protein